MFITNSLNTPKYVRDNIVSHLLVSEVTTESKHITTTLVEMGINGRQHMHSHETEQSYFIIDGSGVMTVDDEQSEVHKGDSIFIPSRSKHGLINTGHSTLVYLSAGSPPFGKEAELKLWPISALPEK